MADDEQVTQTGERKFAPSSTVLSIHQSEVFGGCYLHWHSQIRCSRKETWCSCCIMHYFLITYCTSINNCKSNYSMQLWSTTTTTLICVCVSRQHTMNGKKERTTVTPLNSISLWQLWSERHWSFKTILSAKKQIGHHDNTSTTKNGYHMLVWCRLTSNPHLKWIRLAPWLHVVGRQLTHDWHSTRCGA